MMQKIKSEHHTDENNIPSGGLTVGAGIKIDWQNGPVPDKTDATGAFVEGVISAAVDRLRFYQSASNGKFACRENAVAITKLEEALMWCEWRTRGREARGVEGKHEK